MIKLINMLIRVLRNLVERNKDKWLKDWKYKDYTIVSNAQEAILIGRLIDILKIAFIVLLFIFIIPTIFSIFPFSRTWSNELFQMILTPIKNFFMAVLKFLPNLFIIAVLYFVMRLVTRIVKYFFVEIEAGKLRLPGFHQDFAKPTFTIVRILIVSFFLILIFPYLPGAGSPAFNGISVFIGILVSLGSSSAISNMIAGIVITYMRPFRVGDRIRIENVVGDVLEKNILVTRVKTVLNEEVTIPNSKILSATTMNYTAFAQTKGLILTTEVTFGYEIPWQKVEETMFRAISRCPRILQAPKPFVLQTKLHDFYVVYTVNGYTTEASSQASIYSEIISHIQDVCREEDLELLSPYYQANRDGNERTVPPVYEKREPEKKNPPVLRGETGTNC